MLSVERQFQEEEERHHRQEEQLMAQKKRDLESNQNEGEEDSGMGNSGSTGNLESVF